MNPDNFEQKVFFNINNFDLIRLVAALQVAFHHVLGGLKVDHSTWPLVELSALFPGVPIFFFVSGFLISKSYESNPVLSEYSRNRVLRIYPALIVCTLIALAGVSLTGYLANGNITPSKLIIWIAGQMSFVQFYNPDFMRGFGTGVLNGSLWTITVELQFYLLVPVLYWILGREKKNSRQNIILLFLASFFMAINLSHNALHSEHSDDTMFKLWRVSFSPWFYMFLIGIIFQKNFELLQRVLRGKFILILTVYIITAFSAHKYLGWPIGNGIYPPLYMLLAILIFSFSYSFPTLSTRILKRNDISYGVYIYHIPIINMFIYYGYISKAAFVPFVLGLAVIAAFLSWKFVEKPTIRLKKRPLNPLNTVKAGTF